MALQSAQKGESMDLMERYHDESGSCSSSSHSFRSSIDLEKEIYASEQSPPSLPSRIQRRFQSRSRPGAKINREFNTILHYCMPVLLVLIPSFMHTTILRTKRMDAGPLHPTAYLDGLRGVAALTVVNCHQMLDWFPITTATGYQPEAPHSFVQLPWVRNFYSGRASVCIFFVISGFVLSAKPLRLMHSGADAGILNTISSSLFRRAMRLFFPIIISSSMAFVLIRYDLFIQDFNYPEGKNILPPRLPTLGEQTRHYLDSIRKLTDVWNIKDISILYPFPYDGHLWTIPVEYRGSIAIFLVTLAVSKTKPFLRPITILGCAIYNLWQENWDLFLFLTGTFLAEIQTIVRFPPPHFESSKTIKFLSNNLIKQTLVFSAAAFGSLAIGMPESIPERTHPSLIFKNLAAYTPQSYFEKELTAQFWSSIGAVLLVGAITFSPALQKPFTTRFAQYLGYVSYSIYLMHGNILYTIGMYLLREKVVEGMGSLAWPGREDGVSWEGVAPGYLFAYLKAGVVCMILVFWSGDLFTRFVDSPSVRLAGWIQRRCWADGL